MSLLWFGSGGGGGDRCIDIIVFIFHSRIVALHGSCIDFLPLALLLNGGLFWLSGCVGGQGPSCLAFHDDGLSVGEFDGEVILRDAGEFTVEVVGF